MLDDYKVIIVFQRCYYSLLVFIIEMGGIFKILCSNSKFSLYGAPALDLNLLMHSIHISLYFVACLQLINNLKFGSVAFFILPLWQNATFEKHIMQSLMLLRKAFPIDFWIIREDIHIKILFLKTNSLLKLWIVAVGICYCISKQGVLMCTRTWVSPIKTRVFSKAQMAAKLFSLSWPNPGPNVLSQLWELIT